MPPRKRSRSSPDASRKRTKAATITQDDDEDSLESILAQIQAQEESEALARQLQEEWNASAPSSSASGPAPTRTHSTADDAIEISDGDDPPEDDEAMARRLAKEWEAEDIELIEPSSSHSKSRSRATRNGKNKAEPAASAEVPHLTKLEQHRDLFTGEKTCSCGAKLPSPRGHVRSPFPTPIVLLGRV